jgi:S-formylglutathione hydrolase FrmB
LNSTAQGNYADYVADEIVPAVEAQHPATKRVIAGHSSGGYGALMLAMAWPKLFGGVVALSPDSDFEVTHRPVVEQPEVRRVTQKQVDAFTAEGARAPADGLVSLILGLSAAYTPATQPGRIEWLYDDAGKLRQTVWERWLAKDPLVIVRSRTNAFASDQRIYLDGAAHDEWGFNVSARKIFDLLRERPGPVTFNEPPGGHSDGVPERLARGLVWILRVQ